MELSIPNISDLLERTDNILLQMNKEEFSDQVSTAEDVSPERPDRNFLANLEIAYWSTAEGTYPSLKELAARYSLSVDEVKTEIRKCLPFLQTRGLPTHELEILINPPVKILAPGKTEIEADLDPDFVLAVNLIANTLDKRSISTKLEGIGVKSGQYRAWLKRPKYREYAAKRIDAAFKDVELAVKTSLAKNIEAGDLPSIKYYDERTGLYRPNQELTLNLGIILAKMMEILVKYVTSEQLHEIADQMDQVINTSSTELGELNS